MGEKLNKKPRDIMEFMCNMVGLVSQLTADGEITDVVITDTEPTTSNAKENTIYLVVE